MSEGKRLPQDVDDLNVTLGTNAKELMPPYEDIPKEFKSSSNVWNKFFSDWFFGGVKLVDAVPFEGIDKKKALRHLATICNSFEPQHEHKEAAVAYLASLWFATIEYKSNGETRLAKNLVAAGEEA